MSENNLQMRDAQDLTRMRVHVLDRMLWVTLLVGSAAVAVSAHHEWSGGRRGLALFVVAIFGLVVGAMAARSAPFRLRVALVLGGTYAVGLSEMTIFGRDGLGFLYFFGLIVLSGALLGTVASVRALLLCVVSTCIIAALHVQGILTEVPGQPGRSGEIEIWLPPLLNLVMLGLLTAVFVSLVLKSLEESIRSVEQYMDALRETSGERHRVEQELRNRLGDIERFNRLALGRERRIVQLKEEVNDLLRVAGESPRYDTRRREEGQPVPSETGAVPGTPPRLHDIYAGDQDLADLLDVDQMQLLLDAFCDAVGVAAAIIDLDGHVLVGARWQRICTDFHRTHPLARVRCAESDIHLACQVGEGNRCAMYQCRNGLIDSASPIIIEGRHVANVFVGQFLTQPPDMAFFSRQAAELGVDETAYLEAVEEAPIVPEERLRPILDFLVACAEVVGTTAVTRLRGMAGEAELAMHAEALERLNAELRRQREAALSVAEDARLARAAAEAAQQSLEDSEAKLRSLFQAVPVGISIMNARVQRSVNEAFCEMVGYAEDELVGQNVRILYDDDAEYERVGRGLYDDLQARGTTSVETRFRCKDGTFRDVIVNAALLHPDDPAVGAAVAILDVTDLKRANEALRSSEEQLRQSQKMEAVGQLAGGIAHDFNNLLQVIAGYTDVALIELGDESPVKPHLQEIALAGERAARLVGQLLAFSRRQIMKMECLNLDLIMSDLLKMLGRIIGEHIQIDFMTDDTPGFIYADRGQIEQVLINLCVNARDAMPLGGRLTIRTRNLPVDADWCQAHPPHREHVLLSIHDSGCGMDEETLEHVFEPFFTTKGLGEGTGLGLATVYGIICQHDGVIECRSQLGAGTTFDIYLPAAPPQGEENAPREESPVRGGAETILLAEDDAMVRGLAQTTLERAGYTVLTACNGKEAIKVFEQNADAIQLVILDVVMPELGGEAVYEILKEAYPSMPFLFASGYSANALNEDIIQKGRIELIPKPFRRSDLLQNVRQLIDEYPRD